MDAVDRLAVGRSRRVARAIGLVVTAGGLVAVAGWVFDVAPLAAFGPSPLPPMRFGTGLALAACGGSVLAAVSGRRGAQQALALAAMAVSAFVIVESVTGAAVSPYALVRRLGLVAPELERAAPVPTAVSAAIVVMLGAALAFERSRPSWSAGLSAAAGVASLLGLVDRVGALTAQASDLRSTISTIVLSLATAAAVQALLADRAGAVHALWGEASMRARLLRGFVLPLPFLLAVPLVTMLAVVDDPAAVRLIARWSTATIPAVTIVTALVGARIARRTVDQLRTLSEATRGIAEGRYDELALRHSSDEIGGLAASFDAMRGRLQQRTELEAVLRDAVHAVTTPPDLQGAFHELGEVVARHVPNERAGFSLYEEGALRVVATHGPGAWRLPIGTRLPVSGELYRPAMDRGEAVLAAETAVGDDPLLARLHERGFRSFVSVPVVLRGETRAFVSLGALAPDAFSPEHVALLEAIVREAGGSLVTLAVLDTERETATRLRELDALKDEFVGVVAHDLRSPMTVISGYVDLLLSRWDAIPEKEKIELLRAASNGTKRLSSLVEDILTVARIESGSFPIEAKPFDFAGLIQRTVGEFTVSHPSRDIEAVVPTSLPRALGDEDRYWQVLTNLISNALKFSAPGTPVVVSAGVDGDRLAVQVRDYGVGVAPEDLPRLFRKFSRIGRPVSERTAGNGLGLYICRALVEAQGGSISMSSSVGEGSVVTYTVPVAKEDA